MVTRWFRALIALPLLVLLMVAIPAILFSFVGSRNVLAQDSPLPTPATIPPTPTTATIPPTPTPVIVYPTNTPVIVYPTATPVIIIYPTATPVIIYQPPAPAPVYNPPVVQAAKPVRQAAKPTPTATPEEQEETQEGVALANGTPLKRVIGNRLSHVLYGFDNNNWLYRSADDGQTWLLINTRPSVLDFIMSPADPNVLYSGKGKNCADSEAADEPMYKSINGGMTFVFLNEGKNKRPLLLHGSEKNILLAADCKNLYLTIDGGANWTTHKGDKEFIWNTHRITAAAAAYFAGDPTPERPNWDNLYVVGSNEKGDSSIGYSADSAATWKDITKSLEAVLVGDAIIKVDPYKAKWLWVLDGQGVWATTDPNKEWLLSFEGLQDTIVEDQGGVHLQLNDLLLHPNKTLYLATVRGLYSKKGDTTVWSKITDTPFDQANVTSIFATDTNPKVLWVNTSVGTFAYQVK